MPADFQCASCGAPISFKSGASVFAVCTYCNTAQLKTGASFENLGKMSDLIEDYSVLQLGTQGIADLQRFSVVGRIRLGWERGTWDEWYIVTERGEEGWIAEAQGFYYFSKPLTVSALNINLPLKLREEVQYSNKKYIVKDLKKAKCIFSEGELPFSGAVGEDYLSYDLFTKTGDFLSISLVGEEIVSFIGQVFSFEELSFSNLKRLEGWV